MSKVRLSVPEGIGGSFGGKNDILPEPWVALLALKTGRPVKMEFTREEDMNTSTIRHAYEIHHRTGVMNDGTIVADQVTMLSDRQGLFCHRHWAIVEGVCSLLWSISNSEYSSGGLSCFHEYAECKFNEGNGGTSQSCFAWESHLDLIANRLKMDPVELRRKNLFAEEGMLVNGQVIDARPARECFEKALDLFRHSPEVPHRKNMKRGIGIAAMIYPQDSSGPSGATSLLCKNRCGWVCSSIQWVKRCGTGI